MSKVQVKICGLSTAETVQAAVQAGADYIGFVFFPRSPRHISVPQAVQLKAQVSASVKTVAVTVDAQDALLAEIVQQLKPDYLQLHGDESPERVAEIKQRFGLKVIKALSVSSLKDITEAKRYVDVTDALMFDAKVPTANANTLPGGNGIAFDWSLLAQQDFPLPWFLSGGLNVNNVAQALQVTQAPAVDVSSGVESAPGKKDITLITEFIRHAKH